MWLATSAVANGARHSRRCAVWADCAAVLPYEAPESRCLVWVLTHSQERGGRFVHLDANKQGGISVTHACAISRFCVQPCARRDILWNSRQAEGGGNTISYADVWVKTRTTAVCGHHRCIQANIRWRSWGAGMRRAGRWRERWGKWWRAGKE